MLLTKMLDLPNPLESPLNGSALHPERIDHTPQRQHLDVLKHAEILLTAKVEAEVQKHLVKAQEGAYALGAEAGKIAAEVRIIKALRELKKRGALCKIDDILDALGASEKAKQVNPCQM